MGSLAASACNDIPVHECRRFRIGVLTTDDRTYRTRCNTMSQMMKFMALSLLCIGDGGIVGTPGHWREPRERA